MTAKTPWALIRALPRLWPSTSASRKSRARNLASDGEYSVKFEGIKSLFQKVDPEDGMLKNMGTRFAPEEMGLHGECQQHGSVRRSRATKAQMPLLRHKSVPPKRADLPRGRLFLRASYRCADAGPSDCMGLVNAEVVNRR